MFLFNHKRSCDFTPIMCCAYIDELAQEARGCCNAICIICLTTPANPRLLAALENCILMSRGSYAASLGALFEVIVDRNISFAVQLHTKVIVSFCERDSGFVKFAWILK